MVTFICPTCGINQVKVDMTEEESMRYPEGRGFPFEQIPDCTSCSMSVDEIPAELKPIHKGLLEAAAKKSEICHWGFVVNCPRCHERQFSAYDKIYTFAYHQCVDCTPARDVEAMGDAIFKIVGAI